MAPAAFVFDLYGTLADFSSLHEQLAALAPDARRFVDVWRQKQLAYAFASTLMGRYEDFDALTGYALSFAAAACGVSLGAQRHAELVDSWSTLPPYPEVSATLAALRARGKKLAVLSNGTPRALARIVRHAGIEGAFDAVLSVDAVRAYKPSPAVYALAERALMLERRQIGFVSSNGWDAAGAAEFGFEVFWCNRNRSPAETFGAPPDRTIESLADLVESQ
jgi:2-haloacid dehalogenase